MFKLVFLLFLGLALAYPMLSDEQEWQKFKKEHNKLYKTESEENHRYQVFRENLRKIREHNEKYQKGETTYLQGVNNFADLTPEEYQEIYGHGLLPPKNSEVYYE